MSTTLQQYDQIKYRLGFIAALDQSGGNTAVSLNRYGIPNTEVMSDEDMSSIIHEMRGRIMMSPSFSASRIIGVILFENTMDGEIDGHKTASYLWNEKSIVPFLKVDRGLAEEKEGAQLMLPLTDLDALLEKAAANGIFGTKMRSVIKQANEKSIARVVQQQFEVANRIIEAGLVPIVEPEVDIHSPDKAEAESLLHAHLMEQLGRLGPRQQLMLKLTLPESDNFYADCVGHPNVLRVAALSGGYSRQEANARLSRQNGMIASFSRALTEGLQVSQAAENFDRMLASSIESVFQASVT